MSLHFVHKRRSLPDEVRLLQRGSSLLLNFDEPIIIHKQFVQIKNKTGPNNISTDPGVQLNSTWTMLISNLSSSKRRALFSLDGEWSFFIRVCSLVTTWSKYTHAEIYRKREREREREREKI